MPPSSPTVKYEVRNRIAWVTMNRPEAMNALNREILNAVGEAFVEAGNDDNVLVVIFTGEGGRAFSAGADLKEMTQMDQTVGVERTQAGLSGFEQVSECLKPVIAAIDGHCLAGGMQMASRCDIRIATEKSRFGMPEARRSLTAVGIIDTPEMMMPIGEAKWILFSGSMSNTAQRMYDVGYLQAVVPDREALFAEAERRANEILEAAPLAVQAIKYTIKTWQENAVGPETARRLAGHWLERVAKSEDRLEGPKAFAEKRKPNWKIR